MNYAEHSQTILGCPGAERLRGHGDLLLRRGQDGPIRIQGTYVSDGEVEETMNRLYRIFDFCP